MTMRFSYWCLLGGLLLVFCCCTVSQTVSQPAPRSTPQQVTTPKPAGELSLLDRFVAAAIERTNYQVKYDPSYFVLDYPGGDVPPDKGVCTDEIIRSYRVIGIDLQKEVHEDIKRNFHLYPRKWGLQKPDRNIDHRRVPNLMTFFARKGESLPITANAADYLPGDIVTWDLGGGLTHIGIVVNVPSADPQRYMIVHNIGAGPKMEDVLFSWKITGHYRYLGPAPSDK